MTETSVEDLLAQLSLKLDQNHKDAERYRWLRGSGAIISREPGIPVHKAVFGIGMDAAIDAKMKESKHA